MTYTQLVLIEFKNSCPYVERYVSKNTITVEQVAQYLRETEDWNEDRDSLTFIDDFEEVTI